MNRTRRIHAYRNHLKRGTRLRRPYPEPPTPEPPTPSPTPPPKPKRTK